MRKKENLKFQKKGNKTNKNQNNFVTIYFYFF
jgi:hypothetical protein